MSKLTLEIDRNPSDLLRVRLAIQAIVKCLNRPTIPLTTGAPTDNPGEAGVMKFDAAANTLYVFNGTLWKSTVLT